MVPDKDDWAKLKQVLEYLNDTRNLELLLSINNHDIIHSFVDASYAIYSDCKGHTGSMLTLGVGALTSFSRKQKNKCKEFD